jgi:hypothetical protein
MHGCWPYEVIFFRGVWSECAERARLPITSRANHHLKPAILHRSIEMLFWTVHLLFDCFVCPQLNRRELNRRDFVHAYRSRQSAEDANPK